MDLANLFMFCLISVVIGAVLMLIIQYYIYVRFCHMPTTSPEQKILNEKYTIPSDILRNASHFPDDTSNKSPLVALNLIMQFLFHETKHATPVRKWFYKKLQKELDELVSKTTIGKLFDKLTLRDLDLGGHFPEIKLLRVHDVDFHETEGRIELLDVLIEVKYAGNFMLTIDGDMVLDKKASLTLKVRKFTGLARLQFTRKPYTNWSFSFLGDPDIDLGIDSKFQGRQMQANVSNLISNQIRRAIRRKHTLPKYKIRRKPFFPKLELDIETDVKINGYLKIKIAELSRLLIPNSEISNVYCTLTMSSLPWVEAQPKDNFNLLVYIDVKIHKAKNQQIGILFKQVQTVVEIEDVLPDTPAFKSALRPGDILQSIEGVQVNSIQHVAKIVKSLRKPLFSMRVSRIVAGVINRDDYDESEEMTEKLLDPSLTSSKRTLTPTEQSPYATPVSSIRQRRGSQSSIESSISYTPTNSPKKSTIIAKALKRTLSREHGDAAHLSSAESRSIRTTRSGEETPTKNYAFTTISTPTHTPSVQSPTATLGPTPSHTPIPTPISTPVSTPMPTPTPTPNVTPMPTPMPTPSTTPTPSVQSITAAQTYNMQVTNFPQHTTSLFAVDKLLNIQDVYHFKLDENSLYLNISVYGKYPDGDIQLGYQSISVKTIMSECSNTTLYEMEGIYNLRPPIVDSLKTHYLSGLSGFMPELCYGDMLLCFSWTGNQEQLEIPPKKPPKPRVASEKSDDIEKSNTSFFNPKQHNFVRKHFEKATQCDFCGKKIWLKDAVQCTDCLMICHKKCVIKCQNSTMCGVSEFSTGTLPAGQPGFTVTYSGSVVEDDTEELNEVERKSIDLITGDEFIHQSSISSIINQNLKRVHSANNLCIPILNSASNQNSRSLPPSPNRSPKRSPNRSPKRSPHRSPNRSTHSRQSLTSEDLNAFQSATRILDAIPNEHGVLTEDEIVRVTDPIILISRNEDIMSVAKAASKDLYIDLSVEERIEKISELLSKLRYALDIATADHSKQLQMVRLGNQTVRWKMDEEEPAIKRRESSESEEIEEDPAVPVRDTAPNLNKSDERVQALSVLMLYFCTGLQHAQGVAPP